MTSASWILRKVRLKGCNLILHPESTHFRCSHQSVRLTGAPTFVNYAEVPQISVVTEQHAGTIGLFCCP